MQKGIALFIVALIVFSCKKENELEDSTLGFNPYENPVLPFVTVGQSRAVSADIVSLDLIIHFDRIPDNVDTRTIQQGIIDPRGDTIVTAKEKNIFVYKNINGPSTYRIGLFDTEQKRISALTEYIHQ